jgi:hypothetical protein
MRACQKPDVREGYPCQPSLTVGLLTLTDRGLFGGPVED